MGTSFQDKVKARLAELGITPAEASRRGDLDRFFVQDIVAGTKKSVRGDNLPKLAAALDTTVDWLVNPTASEDLSPEIAAGFTQKDKYVVNIRYSVCSAFVAPHEAEGNMGEIYTGPHRFEAIELFGALLADESARLLYPRGAHLLIARPAGDKSLMPTSGNPVLLKIRDSSGNVQITARRFERLNGADLFLSLDGAATDVPAVFVPDPARDQWQVLGQIVAHGFWPDPVEDGEPVSTLGNMDSDPRHATPEGTQHSPGKKLALAGGGQ